MIHKKSFFKNEKYNHKKLLALRYFFAAFNDVFLLLCVVDKNLLGNIR